MIRGLLTRLSCEYDVRDRYESDKLNEVLNSIQQR